MFYAYVVKTITKLKYFEELKSDSSSARLII